MTFCLNTKIIGPNNKEDIDNALILLHGYGGDSKDISMITLHWKRFLKNTVFLCPNAQDRCSVNPTGYQWFDLSRDDSKYILEYMFSETDRQLFNEDLKENLLSVYSNGQVTIRINRKERENSYSKDLWLHIEYRDIEYGKQFLKRNRPVAANLNDF